MLVTGKAISIHSPLTGRDAGDRGHIPATEDFNPLSPHGERLVASYAAVGFCAISIHSPLTGRDCKDYQNYSCDTNIIPVFCTK